MKRHLIQPINTPSLSPHSQREKQQTLFFNQLINLITMNTKKQYRIAIYDHSNGLCDTLATLACKFNGGQNTLTLKQLQMVCDGNAIQYPSLYEGCKSELLEPDILHIERTIGKETHTIMSIQEIEVLELNMPEMQPHEARDILEELNPILNRGLNNPDNHEAIN